MDNKEIKPTGSEIEMRVFAFGREFFFAFTVLSIADEVALKQAVIGEKESDRHRKQFDASVDVLVKITQRATVKEAGSTDYRPFDWAEFSTDFTPENERIVDQVLGEYLDRIRPKISFL